jgi:hypothetical protein
MPTVVVAPRVVSSDEDSRSLPWSDIVLFTFHFHVIHNLRIYAREAAAATLGSDFRLDLESL